MTVIIQRIQLKKFAFPLTVLTISVAVFKSIAAGIYWTNMANGNWSVAANWNPNSVPGSGDNAFITNNGTYTVTLNVSATVSNLTAGGLTGQQTLAITGSTLTLNAAGTIETNALLNLGSGSVVV